MVYLYYQALYIQYAFMCLTGCKLANTSVHTNKEQETKKERQRHKYREGEHSVNDYGKDESSESSSSFPTSPRRRQQCTVCSVFDTKRKISAVYTLLMVLKTRPSTPVSLEN